MLLQFHEADELHRQQEAHLRARLEQLEKDSEQHQAVVDGLAFKYTDAIEKLQSDKARLEVTDSAPKNDPQDQISCHVSYQFVFCRLWFRRWREKPRSVDSGPRNGT